VAKTLRRAVIYQGLDITMSDSTIKQALNIAVLTVSDTRSEDDDTSGQYLNQAAIADGHNVIHKKIVIDDKFQIRAVVSNWIAAPDIQVYCKRYHPRSVVTIV
jgi:molybdenum cofactor biosynthesis protein B